MKLVPSRARTPRRRGEPFESWMDQFLAEPFGSIAEHLPETFRERRFPAVDISEDEATYTVSVELPGLEEKDIDVQVMGNQLTISGERKFKEERRDKEFHRIESQYGSFARTIMLPNLLKMDTASAEYCKGVLTVRFPKVEPTPTSKIEVKAAR